ncbi:MAG: HAD family hydrolase [Coprobacillus sp.]|nr:HAD family hydrolase [Coprobacillus sp.]
MTPNFKIIFFDVDWTLYDHKHDTFNQKSLYDINTLKRKGYKIILCSDRSYQSLKDLKTFEYISPDGCITLGGQAIIYQDKVLLDHTFTQEEANKILTLLLPLDKSITLTTALEAYMLNGVKEEVNILYSYYKESVPPLKSQYMGEDISQFTLFSDDTYDKEIRDNIPNTINFNRFDKYGVDLTPYSPTKGEAVKYLLDYLKIDKSESLSFGDNTPDISMFKETGYSVCLRNGHRSAKREATKVCSPVWKDGIDKTLKKLKLI